MTNINKRFLLLRKLRKSQKGTVLIEFALVFPLFLIAFLGGTEMFHYLMVQRKVTQTVSTIAHLTTQAKALTPSNINDIFDSVSNVMKPFQTSTSGRIIITYVEGTSAGPKVINQCVSNDNTTLASKIGAKSSRANLSSINGTFTLAAGENAIIAEIFYEFTPYFANLGSEMGGGIFTQQLLYNNSIREPRFNQILFNPGLC
jgi:Flp pilus assembly protein TadG